ncbi:hypothetical protein ACFPRB_18185 [Metabacillus niabensis]|uniref:Uncharacterized protein n=1 Tax=Metabacillus niabensis TaxID=324854 RepID=A0ABT9Z8L8_9BACI|nr:hypothetical protein [Metabacillus niabensis]MDQ0228597.1 hypothetical protein [Metabacillus niabensis]
MSNTELVHDFIYKDGKVYCDDCLSEKLEIKPRQQINQICNRLKEQGKIIRETKECSECKTDKLVNIKL